MDGADEDAQQATESEANAPTVDELLAAPKTQITGGDGVQGRPWVIAGEIGAPTVRAPRVNDPLRPQCPNCSNDQAAVLCTAQGSTGIATRYRCPFRSCSFSTHRLRDRVDPNTLRTRNARPLVERPE